MDKKTKRMNSYYPPARDKRRVSRSENKKSKAKTSRASKAREPERAPEGFQITREEVKQAFAFLNPTGRKALRPKDLKDRLSAFYPNMSAKEYRFLVDQPNFTEESLYQLLNDNDVEDFDPLAEAFQVYDPQGTGTMDESILRGIMEALGYGKLPPEDMKELLKVADVDRDGKVSLDDFKRMIARPNDKEKEKIEQTKASETRTKGRRKIRKLKPNN